MTQRPRDTGRKYQVQRKEAQR